MGYSKTNISSSTAAVTNRFVTSTNMQNAAYTVVNSGAASHGAGFLVTVTHTQVGGVTDALGTITVVGASLAGQTQTEVITPVTGTTATGTKIFRSVTTVTGAGWTRDAGAGSEDTIVVGQAADAYVMGSSGELFAVVVNTAQATSIALADAGGTFATLKASIAEGTYYYQANVSGYLKVTHAGTANFTLLHTGSLPIYTAS